MMFRGHDQRVSTYFPFELIYLFQSRTNTSSLSQLRCRAGGWSAATIVVWVVEKESVLQLHKVRRVNELESKMCYFFSKCCKEVTKAIQKTVIYIDHVDHIELKRPPVHHRAFGLSACYVCTVYMLCLRRRMPDVKRGTTDHALT